MGKRLFRAALFDYNGTLLYDAPNFYKAVCVSIFDRYGMPRPAREEFREEIGIDAQAFYEHRGVSAPWETLQTHITEYFATHKNSNLQPGARKMLVMLSRRRIPLGLITALVPEILRQEFTRHRIEQYFSFVRSGVREKAPVMQEACAMFGCDPREAVYIGDTPSDIRHAKEAGCFAVAWRRGYASIRALQENEPDLLVGSWEEFLEKVSFRQP